MSDEAVDGIPSSLKDFEVISTQKVFCKANTQDKVPKMKQEGGESAEQERRSAEEGTSAENVDGDADAEKMIEELEEFEEEESYVEFKKTFPSTIMSLELCTLIQSARISTVTTYTPDESTFVYFF